MGRCTGCRDSASAGFTLPGLQNNVDVELGKSLDPLSLLAIQLLLGHEPLQALVVSEPAPLVAPPRNIAMSLRSVALLTSPSHKRCAGVQQAVAYGFHKLWVGNHAL